MSKPNKNSQPTPTLQERHGLQHPITEQVHGVDRLRKAMKLSTNVPPNQVCEEAAICIERMPASAPLDSDSAITHSQSPASQL